MFFSVINKGRTGISRILYIYRLLKTHRELNRFEEGAVVQFFVRAHHQRMLWYFIIAGECFFIHEKYLCRVLQDQTCGKTYSEAVCINDLEGSSRQLFCFLERIVAVAHCSYTNNSFFGFFNSCCSRIERAFSCPNGVKVVHMVHRFCCRSNAAVGTAPVQVHVIVVAEPPIVIGVG